MAKGTCRTCRFFRTPAPVKLFSEEDLNTFQLLRCAFDPHQISNPGKIFPTPRLCGERPGPFRMHPLQKAGIVEQF